MSLQRLKVKILGLRSAHVYYLFSLCLLLLFLLFFSSSLYGVIFWGLLFLALIFKFSSKVFAILASFCLFLSCWSSLLNDQILTELFAKYAYLFFWSIIVIQLRLFFRKQGEKKQEKYSFFWKDILNVSLKRISFILLVFSIFFLFQKIWKIPENLIVGDLNFSFFHKEGAVNPIFLWSDYSSFAGQINSALFFFLFVNFPFLKILPSSYGVKFLILETVLVASVGVYFLARRIFQNFVKREDYLILASFLTSFFFLFNPYALNRIFHFYHWVAYSFLPLVFLVFLKFLETKKIVFLFLLAFLLSFISFSPHYLVYSFLVLGLFSLVEGIVFLGRKKGREMLSLILKNLLYLLLFVFFFSALSSYWLVPYLKASFSEERIERPSYFFTKEYIEPPREKFKALRETWSLNGEKTESKILNFFFSLFTLFLPLLFFLPLWPELRNKYTIFFSLLGILAVFFSTMPIWSYRLYQRLLFDIPYLKHFNWLFREAFRINGLLAFAYSFLLGFLFLKLLKIKFNQVKLFYVIMASLVIFWMGIFWVIIR